MRKKNKYFFCDTGARNALISNFNALDLRADTGQLFENFLCIERLKKQAYREIHANSNFWRSDGKKEIDFVEERDGRLFGYEFKWGRKTKKPPAEWIEKNGAEQYCVVDRETYLDFVL